MAKPKKSYTPAPSVPPEMVQRTATILEVIAGRLSVAQAARTLGMSRNHFQTILHRGMGALVESITPKESGRPPKPRQIDSLEQELHRLRRENAHLRERLGTTDRLLQAASGLLQGRIRPARQMRQHKTASSRDDDAGESEPRLREVEHVRALGLSASMAAAVVGVHASTVRRWKQRARQGSPRSCRSRNTVPAQASAQAADIVRRLRGQVGAESLRHSVAGLSRRQAARIKALTLTQMERARKRSLTRVCVTAPGIVRGMDGLQLHAANGTVHALISADAAVPYRTTVKVGRHYDADLVARTLACDIEAHGAPLVYRLDRARAHDAPRVRDVLALHKVLMLHGPPYCPRFYGQLERQNREHRAWTEELEQLPVEEIELRLRAAIQDLNDVWRRRTLGWQTASEVWGNRPEPVVDRVALFEEVNERAALIGRRLQHRGEPADLARRLAIEQALETRGYLRQTAGGWC